MPKRCFFPSVHFSKDLRQNVSIWIAPIVSAFIVVCSRKPKKASGHVQMGLKHNLVYFKSLLGCLLIKSWSSSQHLNAGKRWRVIPSLPSNLFSKGLGHWHLTWRTSLVFLLPSGLWKYFFLLLLSSINTL